MTERALRAQEQIKRLGVSWESVAHAMNALAESLRAIDAADRATLTDVPPGDDFEPSEQVGLARMTRRLKWERDEDD